MTLYFTGPEKLQFGEGVRKPIGSQRDTSRDQSHRETRISLPMRSPLEARHDFMRHAVDGPCAHRQEEVTRREFPS